eukprot:6186111-Pleurochrysis_carterae.AAC.1
MVDQSWEREKIGQNRPFSTMDGFWTIHSGECPPRAVLYKGNARVSILGNGLFRFLKCFVPHT